MKKILIGLMVLGAICLGINIQAENSCPEQKDGKKIERKQEQKAERKCEKSEKNEEQKEQKKHKRMFKCPSCGEEIQLPPPKKDEGKKEGKGKKEKQQRPE